MDGWIDGWMDALMDGRARERGDERWRTSGSQFAYIESPSLSETADFLCHRNRNENR